MKLLVSVRNAHEAEIALQAGVDIIDLKEPDNGPLGSVSPDEMERVARLLNNRQPLSLALGELHDAPPALSPDLSQLDQVSYAKIGLAQCEPLCDWRTSWNSWANQLPPSTEPVAVAYADYQSCNAPRLEEVADLARTSNCRVFLIDTHTKRLGNTFAHVGCDELMTLVRDLQSDSIQVALAGSLKYPDLSQIAKISPDIVAVRGAVCKKNDRQGQLCPTRLKNFQAALGVASGLI